MSVYYVGVFYCMIMLLYCVLFYDFFFFFKQKTAYEMRISDWSSDVCSSDLKAKTETIGKRHLVINHIALVNGIILLAHIAWYDVTAVGGYIKTDIVEPRGR